MRVLLANDHAERELKVLKLVANGSTNREIASLLYISENTVNFHMKNILRKLHLKNRAQAVAYPVQAGLVHSVRPGCATDVNVR